MKEMYWKVSSQLVDSRLAVKHEQAVIRDENGDVVEN
jgi:hypothetical protein